MPKGEFNRHTIEGHLAAARAAQPYLLPFELGGTVITPGLQGFAQCPVSGNITRWVLIGRESGSLVVDVWKSTFAAAPPTITETIAGSEKPTLLSAQVADDDDLTTWEISVVQGDVFGFNVDSVSGITRAFLGLWITPA